MSIDAIVRWFGKAVPKPSQKNFNVQLGCHVEEFVEMLETLQPLESYRGSQRSRLWAIKRDLHDLADDLKKGEILLMVSEENKEGFLDSVCDQIVTSTGAAYMLGMDVEGGLKEVSRSNDSKFSEQGIPMFDANGKITKGPRYKAPDLKPYLERE